MPEESKKNGNRWILILAILIIGILLAGIWAAFITTNFASVPYAVVIMGIIAFFGVLKFNKELSGSDEHRMRKAITVSIVVVYLGLLPTLAFQGILQFQFTGNTTTAITNQTAAAVTAIPQSISLSETVVSSFTALVAAVLLFYFGSRTFDGYVKLRTKETEKSETPEAPAETPTEDPTKTEKETTTVVTDKEGNKETTVVTERIKKVDC